MPCMYLIAWNPSLFMLFSTNSGLSPRNRLAGMKVSPGDTSVLSIFWVMLWIAWQWWTTTRRRDVVCYCFVLFDVGVLVTSGNYGQILYVMMNVINWVKSGLYNKSFGNGNWVIMELKVGLKGYNLGINFSV